MWLANEWKDYKLVDSADGEKLEYWKIFFFVVLTHRLSGQINYLLRCGKKLMQDI